MGLSIPSSPCTRDQSQAPLQHVLFIEKQREFRWHPGMLLPNSRMQIRLASAPRLVVARWLTAFAPLSFLKDLATLRSPQSPITFLNYLHSQDRLLNFINRGSFTPTRKEYADYLSWAADYVRKQGIKVRYGEEVIAISRCENGIVEVRSRDTQSGEEFSRRTRTSFASIHTAPLGVSHSYRKPHPLSRRLRQAPPRSLRPLPPPPHLPQLHLHLLCRKLLCYPPPQLRAPPHRRHRCRPVCNRGSS